MSKKAKLILSVLFFLVAALAFMVYLGAGGYILLDPKGEIGLKEKDLLITAFLLMMIVVIPVFALTARIAWKYQASNEKARYEPEWDNNVWLEVVWWGIPFIIIAILSVITWRSCHDLDPFKPIETGKKPLTIQVVALQWKWLFIYPEQRIASLNLVQFPENTPIHFEITSDAPMNSFWIPQLGGQIYAMPAMKTQLHLIANEKGTFRGLSANFSGEGFSKMIFTAKATSQEEFDQWVQEAKKSGTPLEQEAYTVLAKPSMDNPHATYFLKDPGLFDWVIIKYMLPVPDIRGCKVWIE